MKINLYVILLTALITASGMPRAFAQDAPSGVKYEIVKRGSTDGDDAAEDTKSEDAKPVAKKAQPKITEEQPEEQAPIQTSEKASGYTLNPSNLTHSKENKGFLDYDARESYIGVGSEAGVSSSADGSPSQGFNAGFRFVVDSMKDGFFSTILSVGGTKPLDSSSPDIFRAQASGKWLVQSHKNADGVKAMPVGTIGGALDVGNSGRGKIQGILGFGPGVSFNELCRAYVGPEVQATFGSDQKSFGPGGSLGLVCSISRFYGRFNADAFYNPLTLVSKDSPNPVLGSVQGGLSAGVILPSIDDRDDLMIGVDVNGQTTIHNPAAIDDSNVAAKFAGSGVLTFSYVPGAKPKEVVAK